MELKTDVFATRESWRTYALESLRSVERISVELGIHAHLHLWPDASLGSKATIASQPNPEAYTAWLDSWWNRISEWPKEPTPAPASKPTSNPPQSGFGLRPEDVLNPGTWRCWDE